MHMHLPSSYLCGFDPHATNLGLEIRGFQGRAQQWSEAVGPQPGARTDALTDRWVRAPHSRSHSCNAARVVPLRSQLGKEPAAPG